MKVRSGLALACVAVLVTNGLTACADSSAGRKATDSASPKQPQAVQRASLDSTKALATYRSWASHELALAARSVAVATAATSTERVRGKLNSAELNYIAARPAAERFPDLDRAMAAGQNETYGSEWTGLARIRSELDRRGGPRSAVLRRLLKRLHADLRLASSTVGNQLAIGPRARLRASSHLLSDIERFDLASGDGPLSNATQQRALARLSGAQALWRATRDVVATNRPKVSAEATKALRSVAVALATDIRNRARTGVVVDSAADALSAGLGALPRFQHGARPSTTGASGAGLE